jgi:hypothetical protein
MKKLFNFFCKHKKRTVLFQYYIRTKEVGQGAVYKAYRTYQCENCEEILTKNILVIKCEWLNFEQDQYWLNLLSNNGFSKYEELAVDQNFDNYLIK